MNPQIPIYISIAFLIALCFPIYMIANLGKQYVKPQHAARVFYGVIGFYLVYLIVVGIACLQGAFSENVIPPKIIQFTTVPLLLFLLGIVFNTPFYKTLLKDTPVYEIIRLHRFRLIGSFFLILLSLGLLPPLFALVAGLGDVITALSSIWVARSIKEGKPYANKLAIAWNTFGLVDILITSASAILFTKMNIETGVLGVGVLTTFPFCYIPAFAPATIIFLHISIYRKLLDKKFH